VIDTSISTAPEQLPGSAKAKGRKTPRPRSQVIRKLEPYGYLAPVIVLNNGVRQINPALATNHIQVIKDTHGKTSQLSQSDLDALILYVTSVQ